MSRNNLVIIIDQDRVVKTEALNASLDLLDLLGRMGTSIARIGSQREGRPVLEVHTESP
jgi:hypothetical protein